MILRRIINFRFLLLFTHFLLFSDEHQKSQHLDYEPRAYHGIPYDPLTHSLFIAQHHSTTVHVHSPHTLKKTCTISTEELGLSGGDYIHALCCSDGKLHLAVGDALSVTSLRVYQVITTS